ncbi:hypothetical protein, partial [Klebsiella michiganensis]|uniref:hypothetical protein n=1 Tax=Klebsiella michiganensis TaxID=1134687 RepID=UPI001953D9DD
VVEGEYDCFCVAIDIRWIDHGLLLVLIDLRAPILRQKAAMPSGEKPALWITCLLPRLTSS